MYCEGSPTLFHAACSNRNNGWTYVVVYASVVVRQGTNDQRHRQAGNLWRNVSFPSRISQTKRCATRVIPAARRNRDCDFGIAVGDLAAGKQHLAGSALSN